MRSLTVPEAAVCFSAHGQEHPGSAWGDLDSECRREQRSLLIENQAGMCAWCEQQISLNDSHNDHVRSKHEHPMLTFSIDNIVASCRGVELVRGDAQHNLHCGHARENGSSIPDSLHPYQNDSLECKYKFLSDGEVQLLEDQFDPLEFPIAQEAVQRHLKLNNAVLKEKRQTRIRQLNSCQGQISLEDALACFCGFETLTRQQFLSFDTTET